MKRSSGLIILVFAFLLSGCSATLDDYRGAEPELKLEQFFEGQLEAFGLVQDHKGKVIRRFSVDIRGEWHQGTGIIDEQFLFADGQKTHRCWRLSQLGDDYTGVAGDVVGQALGRVKGNALNWRYQLQVPVGDKTSGIHFDDWMYLVDENNLINRATMSKFGLDVGEVTLYIKKLSSEPHRKPTLGCSLYGKGGGDEK